VAVYRNGKIQRMYWYLAPRPEGDGGWEASLTEAWAYKEEQSATMHQTDKVEA
jgi:hypothetical protein